MVGSEVLVGLLFEICIVDASIFTTGRRQVVIVVMIDAVGWFLAGCVVCVKLVCLFDWGVGWCVSLCVF